MQDILQLQKTTAQSHSLNTVSKIFKNTFNTVGSFHNKGFFYSAKKSWDVQNSFLTVTELNKINVKKKANYISTFDFSTLHATILHKFISEIIDILSLNLKLEYILAFLNYLSTELLRELKEDTSLNKLLSMVCLFS